MPKLCLGNPENIGTPHDSSRETARFWRESGVRTGSSTGRLHICAPQVIPLYEYFYNELDGFNCGAPVASQGARSATEDATSARSVTTHLGAPRVERLDAVFAPGLVARNVDFAAVAHPRRTIGQYLWPGLPAARIDKVDHERTCDEHISIGNRRRQGQA